MSGYRRGNKTNFSVTSEYNGSRSYTGNHDDRWLPNRSYGNSSNRGPRNRGGGRGNRRGQYRNLSAHSSRFRNRPNSPRGDDDGDISMSGDSKRYVNNRGSYSNRGNRNREGRNNVNSRRANPQSFRNVSKEDRWYKIMVPFGAELGQDKLYEMITSVSDSPFAPLSYFTAEKRAFFFVQGFTMAENLRLLSRRITKPDGHKLIFHVSPSDPPKSSPMTDNEKEKLKFRMSDRYDPSSQVLNLSSFYSDEVLKSEHIFLPLNRKANMIAVTDIIKENIPELTGLDLSNNRLLSLGHVSDLVKVTPGVVSLNLSKNQIISVDELDKLKGWVNIKELLLQGNELCSKYSNLTDYISAVRKRFPKVMKLDGKDLPPPMTFGLEAVTLPPSKGSYLFNEEVKKYIVTFVKEYYALFDTDRRKDLTPAYHENAQFSHCVFRNSTLDRQGGFNSYISESRNLKIIGHFDSDKLAKKIKVGVGAVVSYLETFPKTIHDSNSFTLDVNLVAPTMLCFVLHGVFKEAESRADKPFIRSFSRTFVTVSRGTGMVIINDMLTVSNAGLEQARNAFKVDAPTPSSSPTSSSQAPSISSPVSMLSSEQKVLVQSFIKDSGMNVEFSMRCLQDNSWDYQAAAKNFTELKSQGQIPPEAFL